MNIQPQGPLFWIIVLVVMMAGAFLTYLAMLLSGVGAASLVAVVAVFVFCGSPNIHQWLVRRALIGAS